MCKTQGFRCGAAEKVKRPKALLDTENRQVQSPNQFVFAISRSPCTPLDEAITDRDRRYFHCFEILEDYRIAKTVFIRPGTFHANRYHIQDINNHKACCRAFPIFPFSSKPFRFAYLAFVAAYTSNLNTTNSDHLEYICKFHHYVQEVIRCSSYLEIVTASYMALAFESIQRQRQTTRFWNMIVHAKGLSVARFKYSENQAPTKYLMQMQICFASSLSSNTVSNMCCTRLF